MIDSLRHWWGLAVLEYALGWGGMNDTQITSAKPCKSHQMRMGA